MKDTDTRWWLEAMAAVAAFTAECGRRRLWRRRRQQQRRRRAFLGAQLARMATGSLTVTHLSIDC